jgi:arylsulfatase A-like enzyme
MSTRRPHTRLPRLLVLGAVSLAAAACAPRSAFTPSRYNVLFIVADDLNCDLGCYGDRQIRTPNIDRLAARGVRFTRAYCQFPLCSPSRSSFLTGRRPDVTGVLLNPSAQRPYSPHFREKIPDTVTLPQLFKQEGWYAARVGKLYHYGVPLHIGTASLDDYASWDLALNPRGCDRDQLAKVFSLEPGQFGGTLSWLAMDEDDPEHTDGMSAAEAVRLLERFERQQQPFFLSVGFFRPHTPYVAPRRYFDLYPPETIELPALDAKDRERVPAPAYASAKKEQETMTDAQRRLAIQAYRASISFLDAQVGRVLDALDRLDLARSTVVVFTSDHGYHLGDHGLWQKRSLFERSARVPLIVAVPGAAAAGRAAPGVVEMLDIYPTLADLCGLKPPPYLEGVSLRRALEDPEHRVKEAAFTQVDRAGFPGRSVRTERWRYTEWDEGKKGVELYDYERDAGEHQNLAADPALAGEVERLKGLLRAVGIPAAAKSAIP